MDTVWISNFLLISELGSMNLAAEKLGVAQSTLTRRIKSLEAELGFDLLERTSTGVLLTDPGKDFCEKMRHWMPSFENAIYEVRQRSIGKLDKLRIGYMMSFAETRLNPGLLKLKKEQPTIRVELFDMSPGEQIRALENHNSI